MTTLRPIDASVLAKTLIGFDSLFNSRINFNTSSYPPHNIIKYDDLNYGIELAVSGFTKDDISVMIDSSHSAGSNILKITGTHSDKVESADWEYLHRGLASRDFEQTYALAEFMEVREAEVKDGLLKIKIERIIPETLQPRKIEIK
jgi:molecular chaperone IbpA